MEITLQAIMATKPCYSEARVAELLTRGATLETLLSLPRSDARFVLARLLTVPNRVVWARACAERAKGYAYAADADADAYADAYADAADAAAAAAAAADAYADAYAYAYAYAYAEHRMAHALALLEAQ